VSSCCSLDQNEQWHHQKYSNKNRFYCCFSDHRSPLTLFAIDQWNSFFKLLQKDPEYNIYDCIYECIAWGLISEKNAGAIATITNTNICYGDIGDDNHNGILDDAEVYGGFLAVELFRLYAQEHIDTLGVLHQKALSNYVDSLPVDKDKIHCKSVQEFILFGDPSLKIGGYPS